MKWRGSVRSQMHFSPSRPTRALMPYKDIPDQMHFVYMYLKMCAVVFRRFFASTASFQRHHLQMCALTVKPSFDTHLFTPLECFSSKRHVGRLSQRAAAGQISDSMVCRFLARRCGLSFPGRVVTSLATPSTTGMQRPHASPHPFSLYLCLLLISHKLILTVVSGEDEEFLGDSFYDWCAISPVLSPPFSWRICFYSKRMNTHSKQHTFLWGRQHPFQPLVQSSSVISSPIPTGTSFTAIKNFDRRLNALVPRF